MRAMKSSGSSSAQRTRVEAGLSENFCSIEIPHPAVMIEQFLKYFGIQWWLLRCCDVVHRMRLQVHGRNGGGDSRIMEHELQSQARQGTRMRRQKAPQCLDSGQILRTRTGIKISSSKVGRRKDGIFPKCSGKAAFVENAPCDDCNTVGDAQRHETVESRRAENIHDCL